MLRRTLKLIAGTLLVITVAALATAPGQLDHVAPVPDVGAEPAVWIAANEARVDEATPILPGAEKRIRWYADRENSRTDYSVVYLHGFSATRQEVAPVGEMIADALAANLFETRLTGHGLIDDPLSGVRAESWLDDGVEALAIGAAIGDRIVLIGTSTGATLAVALADHDAFTDVASLVMISPNFAVRDPSSEALTWPGGPQLARLMVGETHSWTAANDQQELYWSTTYPTAALVEMMRLVKRARGLLPLELEQPLLTLYSPNDGVVDTEWLLRAVAQMRSPRADTIAIEQSGDPSNHVLAGDILAPDNNAEIADHVVRFVGAPERRSFEP